MTLPKCNIPILQTMFYLISSIFITNKRCCLGIFCVITRIIYIRFRTIIVRHKSSNIILFMYAKFHFITRIFRCNYRLNCLLHRINQLRTIMQRIKHFAQLHLIHIIQNTYSINLKITPNTRISCKIKQSVLHLLLIVLSLKQ